MPENEIKPLFTERYADRIRKVAKLNDEPFIPHNWYLHPKEDAMAVKSIDLTNDACLCDVSSNKGSGSKCTEHWFEAFIINQVKKNHWEFEVNLGDEKVKYQFLSSQLTFRGAGNRSVDLLFFNPKNALLVIWELKSLAVVDVVVTAKNELTSYCSSLKKVFDDSEERKYFKQAYCLDTKEVKGVEGYIVLPRLPNTKDYQSSDYSTDFGLIVYSGEGLIKGRKLVQPWDQFNKTGWPMDIKFERVRPIKKSTIF